MNGVPFKMVKLRSMTVRPPSLGGSPSTPSNDIRITPIGRVVRKYKLDELLQLLNVIVGDMSLGGPRPQVAVGAAAYTAVERRLLTVRPGITDFASIVFSDEGDILAGQPDPDLAYDQLIRPGKSWLGLFYIENRTLALDIRLVFLTGVAIFSKSLALAGVVATLRTLKAPVEMVRIARRNEPLRPMPPPGASLVVATANTAPRS